MKNIYIIALIYFSINSYAQVPQGIPYQAIARNGQGQPLANTNVKVRFSILDSTATGTAVYVESHNTTTSALGLFTANVGMGNASTGTFSAINWGQNFKFLKVELDTTATGNSYIDLGTQQMMSVPYALYAGSAIESITATNTCFSNSQVFSTAGAYSFTVPVGVNKIMVEVWGGGAGGGSGSFSWGFASWGGAAGGYGKSILSVQAGTVYQIVVGIGGQFYSGANNWFFYSFPGGTSNFGNLIQSTGGIGNGQSIGGTSNGQINIQGGPSIYIQYGSNYPMPGGAAPNGGPSSQAAGIAPGGGGGFNNGPGAPGRVIVWY
jgi:hypothetical protein